MWIAIQGIRAKHPEIQGIIGGEHPEIQGIIGG
jgi:hypothetical protein